MKTAQKSISVELVNFAMAGVLIGVSVPAVFWHLSILYACITSFLIGITIIHLVVDYASASLLIQYATCLAYPEQMDSNGLGLSSSGTYEQLRASLMLIRSPVQLPTWALVLLTGLGFLPYLMNFHLLYAFGLACLGRWQSSHRQVEQTHRYYGCRGKVHTSAPVSLQSGYSLHQPADGSSSEANGNGGTHRNIVKPVCPRTKCEFSKTLWIWIHSHNGTITALSGIGFLFLSTSLRIPIQCELMRVYWENGDPLCLTSMVLFVITFLSWLLIWIGFALRRPYLFPLWEPNSMNVKSSTENLIASFNKENSAYVRCNGEDMRLLGITEENRTVPIFLDGDAVLYSTVQKNPNQMSLHRTDPGASPLTLTAYDHHWRPATINVASLVTEKDNCAAANECLEEVTSPRSPTNAASESVPIGGISDTSETMKQSMNSQREDIISSTQIIDNIQQQDPREKPTNYLVDSVLVPTIAEVKFFGNSPGPVNVRGGKRRDSGTDSYLLNAAHQYPVATSPPSNKSNVSNSAAIGNNLNGSSQLIPCDQGNQRISFRHVTRNSPYLVVPNTQTEARTDSSDSGDSACKMSENQDCFTSIRSYRYNLASLESHLMVGAMSNGEGDRSNSPVSLPPPMSALSTHLYDPPSRQDYSDFTDQPVRSWNGTSGLVVLTPRTDDGRTNPNDLFEGKLSSQV